MSSKEIFFAEGGLTTTSANHVANLAKEAYQDLQQQLDNIQFYKKSIRLLDSNAEPYVLENGVKDLGIYEEILLKITNLKSLIAWLREAIKAKEALIKETQRLTTEEICNILGKEYPEYPQPTHTLTEDEYLASLTIKERNEYFHLETFCSVIGSFIHAAGNYNTARKRLSAIIQNPHNVSGSGKDTILTIYEPTVSTEEVDAEFFHLQSVYREHQARLNGIKHKIELAVSTSAEESANNHAKEVAQYTNIVNALEKECTAWKLNKLQEVRDLKITIPNDLQSTFVYVNQLGK